MGVCQSCGAECEEQPQCELGQEGLCVAYDLCPDCLEPYKAAILAALANTYTHLSFPAISKAREGDYTCSMCGSPELAAESEYDDSGACMYMTPDEEGPLFGFTALCQRHADICRETISRIYDEQYVNADDGPTGCQNGPAIVVDEDDDA